MKMTGSFLPLSFLMCIVVIAALAALFYFVGMTNPGMAKDRKKGLKLTLEIENPIIKKGESLNATLTLENKGESEESIEFFTSQKFDLYLYKDNNLLGKWSEDKLFAQQIEQIILKPGESYREKIEWNLSYLDKNTNKYVLPKLGKYELVGVMVGKPELKTRELVIEVKA
jgi:hypothetical protein